MHNEIRTREQYLQEFEGLPSHRELRALAVRFAWRACDREIQSGWRSSAYFSVVIAASYAGYFASRATLQPDHLVLMVTCIGFMASAAWYLVSRAATYQQENWERHVEAVEDEVTGPLLKTVLATEDYSLLQAGVSPCSGCETGRDRNAARATLGLGLAVSAFPRYVPE